MNVLTETPTAEELTELNAMKSVIKITKILCDPPLEQA